MSAISGQPYRTQVKQFNFFRLGKLRPILPLREHLLNDHIVRYHLDPFYAECRAFGRLREKNKDGVLAVRCHGYAFLSPEIESRIAQQFEIRQWYRESEHQGQPLRAIFKDVVRFRASFGRNDFPANSPFGQKKFRAMRTNLEQLNKLGILNMDIRKENYRGGRLFDFSTAITSPHLGLDQNLRPKKRILEDMKDDIGCFDSMVEDEIQKAEEAQRAVTMTSSWKGRLRKRP